MINNTARQPRPVFLLAGGRRSRSKKPDTLLQAVFREFGFASPRIAYSGTASGDDKNFFKFISSSFVEAGADKVTHAVIAPDNADIDKAKQVLADADIVFISGGDVEYGMKVLHDKDLLDFFNELYWQGKPFFGISAGAIMLAEWWVRWRNPDDDASAELFPCLGFAPAICDTHDEEEGWKELITALMLQGTGSRGYGLASGSGIKVTPEGEVTALAGAVFQYIRRPDGNILPIEKVAGVNLSPLLLPHTQEIFSSLRE